MVINGNLYIITVQHSRTLRLDPRQQGFDYEVPYKKAKAVQTKISHNSLAAQQLCAAFNGEMTTEISDSSNDLKEGGPQHLSDNGTLSRCLVTFLPDVLAMTFPTKGFLFLCGIV